MSLYSLVYVTHSLYLRSLFPVESKKMYAIQWFVNLMVD